MIDRIRGLDDLVTADRRIARAEELMMRLSKAVASLDPASRGSEVGRQSLQLMSHTLVAFRAARELLRQRLGAELAGPEARRPAPADDLEAGEKRSSQPALDQEQEEVFRALLNLEIRVNAPGWFDHLWMYALQNDFRPEQDENGPLRIALRQ